MAVLRRASLLALVLVRLAIPDEVAAQEPVTFMALGSDTGEVVGHGSDAYFDGDSAEFFVNRSSGLQRQTVTILVNPKDGSPGWSLGFATPEHEGLVPGKTFYATETQGPASASIGVTSAGMSCGRRTGSFTLRELQLALPEHPGFAVALEFDARCEGAAGSLFGQVRVHSKLSGTRVGQLGMSALSPVAPGTPLRFGTETDSSVPLQFKFVRYEVSTGTWTITQDYSYRPIWSWTPTLGDLDDYYLQVWVRARGSSAAYDEWRPFGPFTIGLSAASIVSLVSDPASPMSAGATITWTAVAGGGTLRLEYQFIKYSPALATWQVVRDWSFDPVWRQATTAVDEGENIVVVLVKSWGGDGTEAIREARALVAAPDGSYALVTIRSGDRTVISQSMLGGPVGYVTASTADGLGVIAQGRSHSDYMSAVMKSADGEVPVVGRYEHAERHPDKGGRIPGLDVYAGLLGTPCATGRYRIIELVQGPAGVPARVAADSEQVCGTSHLFVATRFNSEVPLFNMYPIRSNAPATVGPGTAVTWTADASGGTGPVEYRFFRYDLQQDRWTLVRDWDLDPRFTWRPTAADYGRYSLQVWARTAGSAVAYQDWRSSEPLVVAPADVTVYGVQWDAARARAGEPVTLEAIAGGGSGALEYRFFQFAYATGVWSMIRDYQASNRIEWTPAVGSGGDYAVQVWVRELGSAATYDAWSGAAVRIAPARLLVIAGGPGDPVSQGRAAVLPLVGADAYNSWMSFDAADDRGSWKAVVDLGGPLRTGVYEDANASGVSPTLSVRQSSTACETSTGRFTVNDVVVDGAGALTGASIDFEQLCAGAHEPLYGGVRYNSNVPLVHAFRVAPSTESSTVGSPVTFTGVGSSATGAVEYRFVLLHQETGQWSLLREYDALNSVAWTPRLPGSYVVQLWVRRRGTSVSFESYVNGPPLTVR
jgi:hypothetical protein